MDHDTVMRQAAQCIADAIPRIENAMPTALQLLGPGGMMVTVGMGKSGFVAQKMAATLRSLGRPAFYLHPGDATHGDLGMIDVAHALVVFSNSGETEELAPVLEFAGEAGKTVVAITQNADSTLAKAANVALCYGSVPEAGGPGLAPTTSISVAMAVSDALSVSLGRSGGTYTRDVFARYHPRGSLGSQLRKVSEVMVSDFRSVRPNDNALAILKALCGPCPGFCVVIGSHGVEGVITDGDLRRAAEKLAGGPENFDLLTAVDMMTRSPVSVSDTCLVPDALEVMQGYRVTKLLVEDMLGSVIGVLNLHDCTEV